MNIQEVLREAEGGHAEAQFLLSQICLQNRDLDGMIRWLQQACSQDFPNALDVLGHCYEKGMGIDKDFAKALAYYDRAIQGGSGPAAFRKAELLYKSRQGTTHESLICDLLLTAANANIVPALRTIGYLAMQHASGRGLAIDCFRRAAASGDSVSNFNLDWCLMQGWDEGEALADNIELPESFSLYPDVQNVDKQIVSEEPAIALFKDVLNPVDCAHLMFLSRPTLQRASVIDPAGNKDGMVSNVRTSMSTYLPFAAVDMIGRFVELKIIGAIGEVLTSSEPMSILRYAPGEYYRPHVDYFNPNLTASKELLEDGGQRTASAVTYLQAPSAGGGTSFPRLNLALPAVTGSTLWFRNCDADGQVDERTVHAGDSVIAGEKWVVTKWFREKPTRYLEH